MLRIDEYREAFVNLNGLTAIFDAFGNCSNFQIQYQLIFCVWICTFDKNLVLKMNRYNAIPKLADILSESIKEKVIRMILATFRVRFLYEYEFLYDEFKKKNSISIDKMMDNS